MTIAPIWTKFDFMRTFFNVVFGSLRLVLNFFGLLFNCFSHCFKCAFSGKMGSYLTSWTGHYQNFIALQVWHPSPKHSPLPILLLTASLQNALSLSKNPSLSAMGMLCTLHNTIHHTNTTLTPHKHCTNTTLTLHKHHTNTTLTPH